MSVFFYLRFVTGLVALLRGSGLDFRFVFGGCVGFVATDRGWDVLVPAVRRVAFVSKKTQISNEKVQWYNYN